MPRHAVVALTVFIAWLALLPVHAGAQDRGASPAPEELWKAYPLDQGAAPTAQPTAAASPTARAGTKRQPLAAAAQRDAAAAPVIVLALLVLLATGGAMTFRWTRRGGKREPLAAAKAAGPRAYTVVEREPGRPNGGSGRFTPVSARNRGVRATAAVGGSARARGGPHEPEDPATSEPAGAPSAAAPPAGGAAPPDRRLAWTAKIEWRHAEDGSRFCVIAGGPRTVTLAQSPPLEWPPTGPAAVQAMTDAVAKLSATLEAAGWKTLPPGDSWYAKRFAWEPATTERAEPAPGKPAPARPRRLRMRRLALLCVLIVLGALAALQLNGGDEDARKASPAPTSGATATPARDPEAPRGTDLTIPLLLLLALIPAAVVIRQTRRGR